MSLFDSAARGHNPATSVQRTAAHQDREPGFCFELLGVGGGVLANAETLGLRNTGRVSSLLKSVGAALLLSTLVVKHRE